METTQHVKKSKKKHDPTQGGSDKSTMTIEEQRKSEYQRYEHMLGHRLYHGTHSSFHKPMSPFLELIRDGKVEDFKTQLADFINEYHVTPNENSEPGPSKSDEIDLPSNSPKFAFLYQKNEKGKLLNTALHIASYFHQSSIIPILISSLSSFIDIPSFLNTLNKEHKSSLHIACYTDKGLDVCNGHIAVTGVNVNIQDLNGIAPLHIACFYGNEKIVSVLADAGANLNVQDKYGNTPLHYAVVGSNENAVKVLVTRKADVRLLNKEGKSPLHLSTENDMTDMSDILTSNGGDVSIRYQYKKELDEQRKKKHIVVVSKEEEEVETNSSSVDRWGYIDDDREEHPRDKLNAKKEKKMIEKESSRARRWAPMIIKLDIWLRKNPKKVKSRLQKGLPDALRPEAWKKLCRIKDRDIEVYKQLYNQDSPMAEQIDLDINRSYRNHVIFRERFGKGQIALFNILKAYSNYDKEVAYVQGMSDISAYLLMYLSEEDTFWVLVQLLNDKKYNMRGMFLPEFPLLHQHFYVMERIIASKLPALSKHFKTVGLESPHYLTRWFLLIFLNSLAFPLIVRIWDMFLLKGFDFLFSVSFSLLKMNEETLMTSQLDGVFQTFKELEKIEMIPDEFMKYVEKHKIKSKTLRKYEKEYQNTKAVVVKKKN